MALIFHTEQTWQSGSLVTVSRLNAIAGTMTLRTSVPDTCLIGQEAGAGPALLLPAWSVNLAALAKTDAAGWREGRVGDFAQVNVRLSALFPSGSPPAGSLWCQTANGPGGEPPEQMEGACQHMVADWQDIKEIWVYGNSENTPSAWNPAWWPVMTLWVYDNGGWRRLDKS